jgi:cytochrome c5
MKRVLIALFAVAAIAMFVPVSAKPSKPSFSKDVKPLFQKFCYKCHTGPYSPDKIDLSKIKTDADAKKSLAMLKKSLSEMKKGAMPPKGNPKHSPAQLKAFEAWLKTQK